LNGKDPYNRRFRRELKVVAAKTAKPQDLANAKEANPLQSSSPESTESNTISSIWNHPNSSRAYFISGFCGHFASVASQQAFPLFAMYFMGGLALEESNIGSAGTLADPDCLFVCHHGYPFFCSKGWTGPWMRFVEPPRMAFLMHAVAWHEPFSGWACIIGPFLLHCY
jgi:hypothetical protein